MYSCTKKFIRIIKKYLKNCFLYVSYNSEIEEVALKNNIKIKYEAFADRNYNDNLSLIARINEKSLIENPKEVFNHMYNIIKNGKVKTISGLEKVLKADTFCIHGDAKNAVEVLQFLSVELSKKGIEIA